MNKWQLQWVGAFLFWHGKWFMQQIPRDPTQAGLLKELLPGNKTSHDYVTNDVRKKRCCVWCGRDAWKHKGSHNILEQNDSFSFTLSQHFRNEHRPIQHAAQGSQGGSNGLMIYAGMTHLVYSCLEGSEPGLKDDVMDSFSGVMSSIREHIFFFWSGWFSPLGMIKHLEELQISAHFLAEVRG